MQDLKLVDQTRGILTWVTDNVPGNFHQEVGYATVRATRTACADADTLKELPDDLPRARYYEGLARPCITPETRFIAPYCTSTDILQDDPRMK